MISSRERVARSIPQNTSKRLLLLIAVSLLSGFLVFGLQTAKSQVDFSVLNQYLPDSLEKIYPTPALASDDAIFALDTLGRALFASFASNSDAGRILVIDPDQPEESRLIWLSPEIQGRMEYMYAADINGDGSEELVLATRKLGAEGWSRLNIWSWQDSSAIRIPRCGDSVPDYFSAPTRARVADVDDDGFFEIVLSSIGPSGSDSLIYRWTDKGYCAVQK